MPLYQLTEEQAEAVAVMLENSSVPVKQAQEALAIVAALRSPVEPQE